MTPILNIINAPKSTVKLSVPRGLMASIRDIITPAISDKVKLYVVKNIIMAHESKTADDPSNERSDGRPLRDGAKLLIRMILNDRLL